MSRLNGFHATEPTDVTTAEPSNGYCCPNCDRPFKNPKYKRCYNRSCVASGYTTTSATTKGKQAKATKLAQVDRPPATVDAAVSTPGPTGSLADEIQVMGLMAGLLPAARQRVLSWCQAAFNA